MRTLLLFFLCFIGTSSYSQSTRRYVDQLSDSITPSRNVIYKEVGELSLRLNLFEPDTIPLNNNKRPCVIAFHGGGWSGGHPSMTYPILQEFAKRGWLAISVEYRLLDASKNTGVVDCVKDAKSAIRFVKEHATELRIDSAKITLVGLSAGGHLAAGAILFDDADDPRDNCQISPVPANMILYYPVLDTSPNGYGNKKIGNMWCKFSPLHQVRESLPPTLIFHGMKDNVSPVEGILAFQRKMVAYGNSCDLILHGEGNHGYFLYDKLLFDEVINQTFSYLTRVTNW